MRHRAGPRGQGELRAGTPRGVVTRAQLTESGLDKDAIQRRLDDGQLVRLHASVYALAGTPDTFDRRVRAAFLAAGPDAVVSHRTAAAIQGLIASTSILELPCRGRGAPGSRASQSTGSPPSRGGRSPGGSDSA